jgi:hypothetical protein
MAATLSVAALCGCAASIGLERGPAPGEIAGNPDLRIVAGHFQTAGGLGIGSGASPVGQTVSVDGARLRIDAAAADPDDPIGEIVFYRFRRLDANGAAAPYCPGDAFGFPMAGRWTPDGAHVRAPGQISVVCLGSAEARCVGLGYRPWRLAANGSDLWTYHQACVRALRADYCGTGQTHAGAGDALALYDRLGIQPLRAANGMSFEAAWGADGAACVNHIRAPARMTLRDLRTECANLPKVRLGSSCDERDPALIFTKSRASPGS